MMISVITPTIRREDLLQRCVESVLCQKSEAVIEHIIVNDSGEPLRPAPWMNDSRVIILNTDRLERSVARNTGAALSRGHWLYFLDDDDYALPGAFAAMLAVAESQKAAHVFGSYRVVNETIRTSEVIAPGAPDEFFPGGVFPPDLFTHDIFPLLFAGEVIPPQASWVSREAFFAVGGFDPNLVHAEDVDLFRRIALRFPGQAVRTLFVVAVARTNHPQTTTTDVFLNLKRLHEGMEKCMELPDTLPQIGLRTRRSPYWRGRAAREFAASARRSIERHDPIRAGRRVGACLHLSLPFLFSTDFWKGLRKKGNMAAAWI